MDKKTLIRLFFQMLRIRIIEEKIAEHYTNQEMRCPVHLCIGQEAIPVGVCAHLTNEDYVMSNHRSHGHYLAKGGGLKCMMAEIYGKANGCSSGKGGSMHLTDPSVGFLGATPIVASSIPIAVGTAFAGQLKGEDRVSVAFFGDGATEEGVFHECLNFAALKKLPIIFICENNLYSVYSPLQVRQPEGRRISTLAKGHKIETHLGDGNDVINVYRLTKKAVERARSEKGPSLLEFMTYRFREHCGPAFDNDLGYRSKSEALGWEHRCPIKKMRKFLGDKGIITDGDIVQMEKEIEDEIDSALTYAQKGPFPTEDILMDHVYAS
ncbi:MAG: thiamine pyrophosphate-dependent dehydrogenase E1 component subunit alpha [Deltaproteobacteria bacterium]|nr:thiamine pyrophosphate-dependent dehydrogenase E1 component subunit alpha [Deltaproteobacteria bacterium]